ncbi:MAG: hypothetical protein ABSC94_31395 [Polyangiaceae bacterium]|jgi:hypothetical protein
MRAAVIGGRARGGSWLAAFATLAGCDAVLGLDPRTLQDGGGGDAAIDVGSADSGSDSGFAASSSGSPSPSSANDSGSGTKGRARIPATVVGVRRRRLGRRELGRRRKLGLGRRIRNDGVWLRP